MPKSDFWTLANITIGGLQNVATKTISNSIFTDLALSYFVETTAIEVAGLALPFSWLGLAVGASFTLITEIGAQISHKALHTNHQHHHGHAHSSINEEHTLISNNEEQKEDHHIKKSISCGQQAALILDLIAHANETEAASLLMLYTLFPDASKTIKISTAGVGFFVGFIKSGAEYRTCKENMRDEHDAEHNLVI